MSFVVLSSVAEEGQGWWSRAGRPNRNQAYVAQVARGVGLFTGLFIIAFVASAIAFGDTGEIADDPAGYLREFTGGAGYRLFATLDALFFLVIATLVWSLANLARDVAPLRSRLATLCALAVTVGAIGAFIRLDVYSALAERFRAMPAEEQTVIVELARTASHLVDTTYTFTHLLGGAAFLLVAWALSAHAGMPRWLVALSGVPGLLLSLKFLLQIAAIEGTFVVVLLMLFAVMVLGFALALAAPRAGVSETPSSGVTA